MAYIITNVIAGVGQITLDRPAALNALNLDMVRAMNKVLTEWREDPAVGATQLAVPESSMSP